MSNPRGIYGQVPPETSSGSRSPSASLSRPFLSMLNPAGRYAGYTQAASLLEEDEEGEEQQQSGNSDIFRSNRRVSWEQGSQMTSLRRNDNASSDEDEVPQSLMFETSPSKSKGKQPATAFSQNSKPQHSSSILPTTHPVQILMPPKPSDLNQPEAPDIPPPETPKVMRGLDAYERALWDWVNVYNLDNYLQEVYAYYEGKGIYCIALSKGLNLLCVFCSSLPFMQLIPGLSGRLVS